MIQNQVKDLFEAYAASPLETAMLHDGRVGFRIPEYQRQYDWSEKNIERLYFDLLNGFRRYADGANASAFTFLGTLILVKERAKEQEFSGVSVAVVDGQQRLTSLTLIACALCEDLRRHLYNIDFSIIDNTTAEWLAREAEDRLFALYRCAIGSQHVSPTETVPFPRIVRSNDSRAKRKIDSDYRSPIARFLDGFAEYFRDTNKIEYIPSFLGEGTDVDKLADNYQLIRQLVANLNDDDWYEETECEQFDVQWTERSQCRDLFEKLNDVVHDESKRNRTISNLSKSEGLHKFVRSLLFSSYFCNCVALTRVTTEDEEAAFDIFDALNTTGEPLTALETLKPRVIAFENSIKQYAGSPSERSFEKLHEYVDLRMPSTSKKQAETKKLIVTFALYIQGRKESEDLASQRNFLRKSYEESIRGASDSGRNYIESLADLAEFRYYHWEKDGIRQLSRFYKSPELNIIQLLSSLIRDMNTSLALPIIFRYWSPQLNSQQESEFAEALRAVSAFLVLRRAATGGTAGIDGDFRGIMAPREGRGINRKFGLCAGVGHENPLLSVGELKNALRSLLERKLKVLDKESWVENVSANPLYSHSKELVRFMILAAANHSAPSSDGCGTWTREGVKRSTNEGIFLNYETWVKNYYSTVEHIAPDSRQERGWPVDLYQDNILRHTIGNLTLLPADENSAIGSDSWEKKRKFYLAVTERSETEQKQRIQEARNAGIRFSKTTINILETGERLPLLDPLRSVDHWNKQVVQVRSKNIARLCWDVVWPWLE